MLGCNGTSLVNLVAAFSMAGQRHLPLLDTVAAAATAGLLGEQAASCRQLALLAGSYAQLGYGPAPLLDSIAAK